jgi:tetratricopeptide (TPR) repeat protein
MNLSSYLIINKRSNLLEAREQLFLIKITEAFKQLGIGNHENTVKLLKESIEIYRDMEGLIKLILKSVIPGYKPENYTPKPLIVIDDNSKEAGSYSVVVKKKLIEAADKDSSKDMLEIFRQYDDRELYDSELFSYKAVLLMSEVLYDDAGAELIEGLKRYPNDIRLLSNLSRLYSLTQDYNKSFETFCRVKILSQGKCSLEPRELFPYKYNDNSSGMPRVLLGTMFGDNTINKIGAELSRRGVYAKTLNYCPKYTGYNSDYVINMNQYETGSEIVSRTADAASKLIPEFDIFHFHYGSSLTFNYSDLPLLKELGKKVIVHFWGDEIKSNGKVTKEKLQKMSSYAACCIVPDDETYEHVKEFFEEVYVIKKDEIDKLVDLYRSLI